MKGKPLAKKVIKESEAKKNSMKAGGKKNLKYILILNKY